MADRRRFTEREIQEARESIALVDLIGHSVRLRKRGREHFGQCPFHSDKTPSFSVNEAKGFYHCFGCGAHGDAIAFVMRTEEVDFAEAVARLRGTNGGDDENTGGKRPAKPRSERRADDDADAKARGMAAQKIWQDALSVAGTTAEAYLRSRGITIQIPPTLRYAPNLEHRATGLRFPTMVAAVQARDRRIIGVHRTFLKPDGSGKAGISTPKMMLGRVSGGAVRFGPASATLFVAEGIETALSIQQATGTTTWAALSTSGIRALALPPQVREVAICADGDEPGIAAAKEAAERFVREGRAARVATAPAGQDFNDVLTVGAAA